MNEYKRAAIAKLTGEDPIKPKQKVKHTYALYNMRDGSIIIKGEYSLCRWKKNQEAKLNPLLRTEIKIFTA